jgi:hypothetical protein
LIKRRVERVSNLRQNGITERKSEVRHANTYMIYTTITCNLEHL